jgi:hypothetical protein
MGIKQRIGVYFIVVELGSVALSSPLFYVN